MGGPIRINHPKQAWLVDFACAIITITLVLFLAFAAGFVLWAMFRAN
jgi:hypothetical protein